MGRAIRPLATVTGASSGIGLELARCCIQEGFDLVIAADDPAIENVATELAASGATVTPVIADLSTRSGVEAVYRAAAGQPVEALLANAGRGLGGPFLDQDLDEIEHVIDTNITGTIALVQRVGRDMRARGRGRILLTGSIAGYIPGTYSAVYNGSKAFVDSFAFALRAELKDTGVSVTCLMPGPTDTEFFARAGMEDTRYGQGEKDDPADVARAGVAAMLRGEGDVVTGWRNKLQTILASVTPSGLLAELHRRQAEPGSGDAR
jgi:short-subunit dehydrogenase